MKIGLSLLFLIVGEVLFCQNLIPSSSQFVLKLDNETSAPEFIDIGAFQVIEGDCYYLNRISRSLKVFSLETGEIVKSIKLAWEGPNTVGPQVEVFHVINKDSILVFSEFYKNKVSLINAEAKVLGSYATWPSFNGKQLYSGSMLSQKLGGIKKTGDQILLAHCIYNQQILKSSSVITAVNLIDGSVKIMNDLPAISSLVDVKKLAILPAFLSPTIEVIGDDRIFVNYPLSSQLYSYSMQQGKSEFHDLRSRYFDGIRLKNSKSSNRLSEKNFKDELRSISMLSGYYFQFIHDPYRKMYYRIMRLPYDEGHYRKYKEGLIDKMTKQPQFSVMVLDGDLNVVTEQIFDKDRYDFQKGMFVAEEGLFVYDRSNSTEDSMAFNILKFNQ